MTTIEGALDDTAEFFNEVWGKLSSFSPSSFLPESTSRKIKNFATEAFATLTSVLPNAIRFYWKLYITKEITAFSIEITVGKVKQVATVYLHGNVTKKTDQNGSPILFLHGDHGHPFTTLNFAEIAEKSEQGPVFSIYLPYDDEDPSGHRDLLKQAVDKIESMVKGQGIAFKGLTLVGHSKGAIEGCYLAFVERDVRIIKVICLAGRLRVVESDDKPCPPAIRETVNKVYEAIQRHPDLPLYQIAGDQDWNAPQEAMFIRAGSEFNYVVQGAMHLNVLYQEETLQKFKEFLNR